MAGEHSSEVIARYGFHRSTIYGWRKAERGRGNGLRALASCPGDGTSTYRGKRGRCFGGSTAKTPGSMDSISDCGCGISCVKLVKQRF